MAIVIGEYTFRADRFGWTLIRREGCGFSDGEKVVFDLFRAHRV